MNKNITEKHDTKEDILANILTNVFNSPQKGKNTKKTKTSQSEINNTCLNQIT